VNAKAYKIAALVGLVLLAALSPAFGQTAKPEEKLMQEAKVLLFDGKWDEALDRLETFLRVYPATALAPQALFYKAKVLSNLDGREPEAISTFQDYLRTKDRNPSLTEESEITLIDLAYELYSRGNRSYLKEIENRLTNPNSVVRYYAAFKMSYFKDKTQAAKALPVLKSIFKDESDPELRDRAKIALLRVDPEALEAVGQEKSSPSRAKLLRIEVSEAGRPKVKVSIPWALADLAIQAIPSREKQMLRQKGYDLDRIFKELERTKSSIIEISEEKTLIKIWID
jgi:tetratricopeptide (TPR) repeat protein